MKITKKKLLKSTVAKVMAAAMVITMIPAPVIVNAEETTTESDAYTQMPDAPSGKIILDKNVTLSTTWSPSETVELDLNGYTVTCTKSARIEVKNNVQLTITDTSNSKTGTIKKDKNAEEQPTSLIKVGDTNSQGTVKLNAGNIENMHKSGYGIAAAGGSSVYINGGSVKSYYAALSGNYNWGESNFYVSSGELEAKIGPCIYKPSLGNLKIGPDATDNTATKATESEPKLIGGVSIRMGNVSISGGIIKATPNDGSKKIGEESLEESTVWSPAKYYTNTHQNVYFPDALFVLGGSYGAGEKDVSNNDLTLNITGGTFVCNNDKGSAVAIYDFGRINQNMNITVAGGKFTKNSENKINYEDDTPQDNSANTRTAFDLLSLKGDIFNTDTGNLGDYGVKDSLKNATISIKKGTFTGGLSEKSKNKIDTNSCYLNDVNSITVDEHNKNGKEEERAAQKGKAGNVQYTYCTNCNKKYVDGVETEKNENELKTYCLSANETEGIEVTFSDGTATGSYGMLRDELLTITRKDGYKFAAAPKVNLASDAPIQLTDFQTSDNGSSYTSTITHKSSITSESLKDYEISIVPNVEKIGYEIKLDKSSLKNADATLGSTTLTSDGSTTLTVTPNKGYTFKNDPVVKAEGGKIEKTTVANGVYSYKISGLTKDCTITVSGEAQQSSQEEKPVQHSIKFSNNTVPKISNAKVSLDPSSALVSHSGSVKLIITPDAGYKITETKVDVKDNGKVCKLSATPELGANGIFVYTISDITADVEITSVTAKTETAKLVELGTNTSTNANEANLSETFEDSDSTEENHNNILSAIKSIISNVTKDTVIFTNNTTTLSDEQKEKLVEDVKKAVESDTSKIAISLVVKNTDVENSVKETAKNEIAKKNTSSSTSTTIGELYPLDISLFAQVIGNNQVKVKLEDTNKGNIIIKMAIPKDIPKKADKATRKYYVVRFHKDKDGKESKDVIDVTENKDGTLSFTSSKFSTYVLSYVDTIPSTGQNNSILISGGGTSVTYPSTTSTSTASAAPSTSATPAPSAAPSATSSAAPNVTSSAAPNTTIPSTAPSAIPDTSQSEEPSASATPAQAVKVGQRVNAGTVKYKVVSVNSRTVTVTGSKSVKNIVIPANIKIGEKAYKVTAITNNAFKGNKKLAKITIGANIKKIGKNAFYGCTNLKKITIKTTKLTAKKIGKNAFKGINRKAVIKVPKSKIKAYKKIIAARGAVKTVKIR